MGLGSSHPVAGVGEFEVAISGGVWVAIRESGARNCKHRTNCDWASFLLKLSSNLIGNAACSIGGIKRPLPKFQNGVATNISHHQCRHRCNVRRATPQVQLQFVNQSVRNAGLHATQQNHNEPRIDPSSEKEHRFWSCSPSTFVATKTLAHCRGRRLQFH